VDSVTKILHYASLNHKSNKKKTEQNLHDPKIKEFGDETTGTGAARP
jgi:hypothetical protein